MRSYRMSCGPSRFANAVHALRRISLVGGVLFALLLGGATGESQNSIASKRIEFAVEGQTVRLPYESSQPIDESNPDVRRVVISIHGSNHEVYPQYFETTLAAQAAKKDEETVIVAPHFLREDHVFGQPEVGDRLLYWEVFPFWGSLRSLVGPDAIPVRISSFDVLDKLLERLYDQQLFPNLETIVIFGFSAGGQMIQRYAGSTRFETSYGLLRDVQFRYVVMAPSSFMYLDKRRAVEGSKSEFQVPNTEDCPDFNDYGFGLDELYAYFDVNSVTASRVRDQYRSREIHYLVGEDDDDTDHPGLDTRCPAMLQGQHRRERMEVFYNYLRSYYNDDISQNHSIDVVSGVGHDFDLITSPQGRASLFD